jgi:acetyl esterase/lipase
VVAFFPPVRVITGPDRDNGDFPASAGDSLGDGITAEEARAASPIERVRAEFPPTLLLHGTADEVVPSRSSQQFYEAVAAVGTPVELRLYSGQRHEFVKIEEMLDLTMRDVALFIRRVLIEPARFDIPQAELFGAPAAR